MSKSEHYLPRVDGLRAVAVLLVFIVHTYPDYLPGGWIGVDLFFVISGYLITSILLREAAQTGSVSIGQFYLRRLFRILPALFVCVTFVAVFLPWTISGPTDDPTLNTLAALAGFMNWLRALTPTTGLALGHTWSLGIEEQFYALWVLAIFIFPSRATILRLAIVGVVSIGIWRVELSFSGASIARIYNGLDTHGDGLLVGCALAALPRALPVWVSRMWLAPALGLGVAAVALDWQSPLLFYGAPSLISIACGWIVYAAATAAPKTAWLGAPLSVWLGKRSYSFYLWHMPIVVALPALGYSRVVWVVPAFVLTLAAAAISQKLVERPFVALKDRLATSTRQPSRA